MQQEGKHNQHWNTKTFSETWVELFWNGFDSWDRVNILHIQKVKLNQSSRENTRIEYRWKDLIIYQIDNITNTEGEKKNESK